MLMGRFSYLFHGEIAAEVFPTGGVYFLFLAEDERKIKNKCHKTAHRVPRQSTVKYVYTHIHELSGPYLVPFISSSDRFAAAAAATVVIFHHSSFVSFSRLLSHRPFYFSFSCVYREINQYVLAFWANSMRIDHVQTIKHVPHSVY